MIILKRALTIFLIGFYCFSQSIFSHLVIIEDHHDIQDDHSVEHLHEDVPTQQQQYSHGESAGCENTFCETICVSIEESKVIKYEGYTDLQLRNIVSYHYIIPSIQENKNPPGEENFLSKYVLAPPIPLEILMPRIGVTVRII